MRRFSFGLSGNQLGSTFGIAVAICGCMIADGLIQEIQKTSRKTIINKGGM